jgi:hypothetical protein
MRSRLFLAYILLATLVVASPIVLWQRQSRIEARYDRIEQAQMVIAEDRVDRMVADCDKTNAIPAAIANADATSSPVRLSGQDRIALRGYIERAVETVAHPKTCTVKSLHLEKLAAIATRSAP